MVRTNRGEFDEAFERLLKRSYGVAYQVLRNREDAEDVAIETMVRVFLRWAKLRPDPDAWVTRVASNAAIDLWRRNRRQYQLENRDQEKVEGLASATGVEDRVDLLEALQTLPGRQKEVLSLRYLLDLSEEEIAQTLGCSQGSVKQHTSRGLASLRKKLSVQIERRSS